MVVSNREWINSMRLNIYVPRRKHRRCCIREVAVPSDMIVGQPVQDARLISD